MPPKEELKWGWMIFGELFASNHGIFMMQRLHAGSLDTEELWQQHWDPHLDLELVVFGQLILPAKGKSKVF